MAGTGWDCTIQPTCTRIDSLAGGVSYSPITVTASVSATPAATLTNQVSVTNAGSTLTASDTGSTNTFTCQLTGGQTTNVVDLQLVINELSGTTVATHDLDHDGKVNGADTSKLLAVVQGGSCQY